MTLDTRRAGILLHPSSLPSKFGIGDCGPETTNLFNWMSRAGLVHWQILPLGPTGFGDSPYQCFSAFAGNPLLISPEKLYDANLVSLEDLAAMERDDGPINYGEVFHSKKRLLQTAFHNFETQRDHPWHTELLRWTESPSIEYWLPDYALYMAIKDSKDGQPWHDWPDALRTRQTAALVEAVNELADGLRFHTFSQFVFFRQWNEVRQEAKVRGITIIGDAPIYVSADSADAWAFQPFFQMDDAGRPTAVAGVPPDYFSATGQLWGNPLYDWEAMQADDFQWWIERMRAIFETVDIVRLDHFRGFLGYYAVPADAPTAETGEWKRAPGEAFFAALEARMGNLHIIAENLGEITTDVEIARNTFNYPGMVILQFAWSASAENPTIIDPENTFAPHMHEVNSVVYTGTHDNDTTLGWWRNSSTESERRTMQLYLATDGNSANWDLVRCGMASVANTFIVPAQDLLNKDTDARMNMPGRGDGNWSWRLYPGELNGELADQIRGLTLLYGRCSNPPPEAIISREKLPPY